MLDQILVKSWIKKNYKNEEFKDQFTNRLWFVWDCLKALNPQVKQPIDLVGEDQVIKVTNGLMSFINQIDDIEKARFDKVEIDFSKFSDLEPEWLKIIRLGQKYPDLIEDLRYKVMTFDSKYNEFSTNFFNRFETTIRLHWGIKFNLSVLFQEYLFARVTDNRIYDFFANPNNFTPEHFVERLGNTFGLDRRVYEAFATEIIEVAKVFYWKNIAGLKLCDLSQYPTFEIQTRKSNFDPDLYDRMVLELWDEKTVQFLFNERELNVHDLTTRQYINNEHGSEPIKNENLLVAEREHRNYLIFVNHREAGIENLSRMEYTRENNYIINYQYSKYLSNKYYFPEANLSGICLVTNFNNSKVRSYFADETTLHDALPDDNWIWKTEIYHILLDTLLNQESKLSPSELNERLNLRASRIETWMSSQEEHETPFHPKHNLVLWGEFYENGVIKAPTDAQFQYKFLSNLNPTPSQLNGIINFLKWNKTYGNCLKSDVELFDPDQTIRAYKAYIVMQKLEPSMKEDSRFRLELGHLLEPEILQSYRNKYQNRDFQRLVQSDKRTYAWFNDHKWFFLDIDGYFGESLNHPEQIIEIKSSGSPKYIGDVATYVKSYYLQVCMYNKIFKPKNGVKMLLMLTSNLPLYQQNADKNNDRKIRTEYKIHEVNVRIKQEWQDNFQTALKYWELAKQELLKDPEFVERYRAKIQTVLNELGTTQAALVRNFNTYLADNHLDLKYWPDISLQATDTAPTSDEVREIQNPSNLDDEQYQELKAILQVKKEGD